MKYLAFCFVEVVVVVKVFLRSQDEVNYYPGEPHLDHGCKTDHPRPDFLSQFPFLLLKPTQKGDGKPTQKPSIQERLVPIMYQELYQ